MTNSQAPSYEQPPQMGTPMLGEFDRCTSEADAGNDQPRVHAYTANLEEGLDALAKVVSILEDRLGPVILGGTVSQTKDDPQLIPVGSPHAVRISYATNSVLRSRLRLEEILNLLEV